MLTERSSTSDGSTFYTFSPGLLRNHQLVCRVHGDSVSTMLKIMIRQDNVAFAQWFSKLTAASLFSEYKSRCIEESPFPWPPLVALSPRATSVASFLGVFPERVYKYTCGYVTKYILHKWQHTIYVLCCAFLFLEYPGNDSTSVRKIVGFNAPQGRLATSGDILVFWLSPLLLASSG